MTTYLSKILSCLTRILLTINRQNERLLVYLLSINNYLLQNECTKFSDCVLVNKLKARRLPCSDRSIENLWVVENIEIKGGKLLDVGSTTSKIFRATLDYKVEVHAINLN